MRSEERKKKKVKGAVFGKPDEERERKNVPVNFFLLYFRKIFNSEVEFFDRYSSPYLAFCLKEFKKRPINF